MKEKTLNAKYGALALEKELFEEFKILQDNIPKLSKLSHALSLLDMLKSFAKASSEHDYVAPN